MVTDKEIAYLVQGANSVRDLIRVKIADENDLNQARVRQPSSSWHRLHHSLPGSSPSSSPSSSSTLVVFATASIFTRNPHHSPNALCSHAVARCYRSPCASSLASFGGW